MDMPEQNSAIAQTPAAICQLRIFNQIPANPGHNCAPSAKGYTMNNTSLPKNGLLRLRQIIGDPPGTGPIPVCGSTWYNMLDAGIAPRPVKIGRTSAWRADEIHALIDRLSEQRS